MNEAEDFDIHDGEPDNIVQYHSKIVGVTFEGRQEVLKVLQGNEPLRVRREPENEHDKNAVAVDVLFGEDWTPVGYIARDKNQDIANTLDAGNDVHISIASITGGGDKSVGLNIALEYKKIPRVEKAAQEERAITTEPVRADYKKMLEEALVGLGVIGRQATSQVLYTSRLIGKSTQVTVNDGHMSIPGYLSGSAFPDKFYESFDEATNLQKIVDTYYKGIDEQKAQIIKDALLSMWGLNRVASTGYGTAVHAALENYDTYHVLGDKTKKVKVLKTKTNVGPNKALSKNPFLKKIVEDFHSKFGGDYVRLNEQFVWLHDKKLAGKIDRVKIVDADKKIIRIQDFKTDGDITEMKYQLPESPFRGPGKKAIADGAKPKPNTVEDTLLGLHWLQLSFYAYILKHYGYTVEGLDVYWLNPNKLIKGDNPWEEFSHEVIDIEKGL